MDELDVGVSSQMPAIFAALRPTMEELPKASKWRPLMMVIAASTAASIYPTERRSMPDSGSAAEGFRLPTMASEIRGYSLAWLAGGGPSMGLAVVEGADDEDCPWDGPVDDEDALDRFAFPSSTTLSPSAYT